MIDEIRQIAIFIKAIDHGSFRGAANDLQLAPSVVSHHISQLEEKLGVALIYRSTRKLTLTQEGKLLLTSARALDTIESTLDALRGQASKPSGLLRVTLTAGLSQSQLISRIVAFGFQHPKIKIQLEFTDKQRHLINDGFDLAIRVGPNLKRAPNRKILFKGKRCLVGATSYLSQGNKIEEPEDLNNCNWIELAPVSGSKVTFKKAGERNIQIAPGGQISANDALSLYRLAKAGAGLAIVPEFLALDDIASGVMQLVLPDWKLDSLDVYAEWPANAPKGGITKLLVKELCKSDE